MTEYPYAQYNDEERAAALVSAKRYIDWMDAQANMGRWYGRQQGVQMQGRGWLVEPETGKRHTCHGWIQYYQRNRAAITTALFAAIRQDAT